LWLQRRQWQNCKSKQAVRFDSKPILFWLQRDVDATGNFIHFLILSKLKLGLELKQKFAPKPQIKNNSTYPCKCEKVPSFTIVEFEGLA